MKSSKKKKHTTPVLEKKFSYIETAVKKREPEQLQKQLVFMQNSGKTLVIRKKGSKWVFQNNKAHQIFQKQTSLTP